MDNPSPSPGLVRVCPSCKSPVEPGNKFCQVCGTKMEELPVCRNCGAQFIAPVKFCELCGTPVAPQEQVHPAEDEPEVTAPEPEEPEPDRPLPEPEEPESVYDDPEQDEPEPVHEEGEQKPKRPAPVRTPPPAKPASTITPDPLSAAFSGLSDEPARPAPAKRSMNKALIGGAVVVLLILIAAVYFVGMPLLKGGTAPVGAAQPQGLPDTPAPPSTTLPATMPPTTEQTPVPATTANPLVPQETQLIPKNQEVFFDVQKDAVSDDITVLFQRGPGENIISYADVKVTYPDGTTRTGTIKPSLGQTELVLDGSRGTDRVEVIAYMHTGKNYRVKDEMVT